MKALRVFLLLFASLFFIVNLNSPIESCVYSPAYFEGYLTFFQSNLAHDSLFERYYYDAENQRSPYDMDSAISAARVAENLAEWREFFGATVPVESISELVYKKPVTELQKIYQQAMSGKKPAPTANPALNDLVKTGRLAALEYLIFAKQCEPFVTVSDPWFYDYETEIKEKRKSPEMQKLIDTGLIRYRTVIIPFLKVRYAYQVVRLANFAEKSQDCLEYYDQLAANAHSASIIAGWSVRHKIGALQKLGRQAESLYQASLLFDQNPKMMDEAYLDFRIPSQPVWEKCLRLAGSKHRQATLWMLRGLQEKRILLEPLHKIYELEPQSSRLVVMLVRHINRIEREYLNSALFFDTTNQEMLENKELAVKYGRELQEFIRSVDKEKVRQPALWYAAAGYMSILDHRFQEAAEFLTQAEKLNPRSINLRNQVQLLQNLNTIAASPRMTETIEKSCVGTLQWLESINGIKSNAGIVRESFYALLAQKYLAAGDYPKGYCCLAKADLGSDDLLEKYPSLHELDQLITFMAKKEQTAFEKVITVHPKYSLDDLYAVKGTMLLRTSKFREALACFEKISVNHWNQVKKNWSGEEWDGWNEWGQLRTGFEKNYYNAATGLYKYPPKGFKHYTKLEFTSKVAELEETARTHPEKADICYFQIANGFFHTPFWSYNENLKGSKYIGNFNPYDFSGFMNEMVQRTDKFDAGIYERKIALRYYLKAMQVTKDPELAAQCCFLAQACNTEFSYYKAFEEPGKDENYYFEILRIKYGQTEFYKSVIQECDTLKEYINK